MNISIFKAYDIRGIYPTELDEDTAYRVGRAFITFLESTLNKSPLEIGVSNDMRLSSPQIKGALIHGMLDSGAIVYDIGFSTTPSFYYAIAFHQFDGGIQVSASHNPKQFNGFKLVKAGAVPISEDTGIYEIRDLADANHFKSPAKAGIYRTIKPIVEVEAKNLLDQKILNHIKPFTIVVDSANSASALDIEAFFEHLPQVKLIKMSFELDGNFPHHDPDPLKDENLKPLQEAVLKHHADLGIAPDGDGDRYFIVDNEGVIIRQEILRGIMAQIAIKENPGATVCYDIRPGRITKDMIEAVGGKASVTRVGHSLIKEQMLKDNAVFGGESSGHYFYKTKWGTFEVPMLLLQKFLAYISKQNMPLSTIVTPLKKYFHSGEINSDVKDQQGKIKQIAENYHDAEISYLDGITVTYPDYWFNVRASNTEPKLRLNLEAKSLPLMTTKRDEVLKLIRS
jgi:phosphomannomutase